MYNLKVTYCHLWTWSKLLLSSLKFLLILQHKVVYKKTHFLRRYIITLGIVCLCTLLIVIAKQNQWRIVFSWTWMDIHCHLVGLMIFVEEKTSFPAWSLIAISACIIFLLNDRHTNLVPLHNLLDESKFLNNNVGRKKNQGSLLYSRKKMLQKLFNFQVFKIESFIIINKIFNF